jgi:hypothetical protein
MKRIRKEKPIKRFMYQYYIDDGEIKFATKPEEVDGDLLKEPFASIYGFLQSRIAFLEKQPDQNQALNEAKIYVAHLESLIFRRKS